MEVCGRGRGDRGRVGVCVCEGGGGECCEKDDGNVSLMGTNFLLAIDSVLSQKRIEKQERIP